MSAAGDAVEPPVAAALERRYRLLLACYPRQHRAEYGEEMLGVLMRDAGPERRWPVPAAVADLVRGGLVAWLRRAGAGGRAGAWAAVGDVLAVLLPFAMVAYSLPLDVSLVQLWPEYQGRHLETLFYPETTLIAWALVLVLALARWRRATVALAWALAAFQVVLLVADVTSGPVELLGGHTGCWAVVAVIAAAALTSRAHRRAGAGPLGPLGAVAGLGACLLAMLAYQPLHLIFPFVPPHQQPPDLLLAGRFTQPVLATLAAALLVVVAVRVTRRAGLGVTLRLAAVLAALGVLFLGGSLESGVLPVGPYLAVRWLLGPALVFASILMVARLAERVRRVPGTSS